MQRLIVDAVKQKETTLVAEHETAFGSVSEENKILRAELEQFRFTDPAKDALSENCGGMDNPIMKDMALNQIRAMFKKDDKGNWIPDPEGPTKGMHPTESKELDFDGAAIWLAANVPAFEKKSTKSDIGGDGGKQTHKPAEGSIEERLKKAKTPEETKAILAEAKKAAKAITR